MLHDPSHKTVPEIAREIVLKQEEVDVLQSLAEEWAKIASLPVHKEKTQLWQKMNDLDSERPMVWINEIPWHEMNFQNDLSLLCENEWARSQEELMRRRLLDILGEDVELKLSYVEQIPPLPSGKRPNVVNEWHRAAA